jgi:hypothetical protein
MAKSFQVHHVGKADVKDSESQRNCLKREFESLGHGIAGLRENDSQGVKLQDFACMPGAPNAADRSALSTSILVFRLRTT